MDIKAIRLSNLIKLISNEESQEAFSRKVDIEPSYLSQIKNPNNPKNLGEKLARKIEASLGLEKGWMDQLHDGDVPEKISDNSMTMDELEHEMLTLMHSQTLKQKAILLEIAKTLTKAK